MSLLERLRRFPWWHEAVLAGMLLTLLIVGGRLDPIFVSANAQLELSTHMWELALLSIPVTLIIITAGIDLSVGAMMALSAVVLGLTYERGLSPWIGACLALATGALAGATNGFFVSRIKVHPLIVTLATMAAFRGVAEGVSLARPISNFPEGFATIGRGDLLGVPLPGLYFVTVALVVAVMLGKTPMGRSIYAIGNNETATRFSGIAVGRIKMFLYTFSGLMAGLAGVVYVARRNTAKADIATGLELDVITAVVLGGTSIFGGRGNIMGTVLGVLLIHETREFVSWYWSRDELNPIVIGALLILSVLLNRLFRRRSATE
ncbi:ABC transporter permease [Candidatus Hydrogenedentota bacterium]